MTNKTLWFSYSTVYGIDAPEPPNSPYSITYHLGRFLRTKAAEHGYAFEYRNLDDCTPVTIGADDIIIGHSWHPNGFLTETLDQPCKARFLLQPYQHDIVGRNESWWIKKIADACDHLFFVTGRYWWDTMEDGLYGDWKEKATRLDMAINPALHPHSKTHWNAPGKRRVLAIGADIPYKGLDMIADFARCGGFHVGYFGSAPYERFAHVPQFKHYGGADFTPELQRYLTDEYDFFVSLARGDSNPTTLLETACWGLLPMCNCLSGYWPNQPFPELKKDDMPFNLAQMDLVQSMPEYKLNELTGFIRRQVVENHGWPQFCSTIWNEVEKWL
jgi:hypothetical protein